MDFLRCSGNRLFSSWICSEASEYLSESGFIISSRFTILSYSAIGGTGTNREWSALDDNPWIPIPFPPIQPAYL